MIIRFSDDYSQIIALVKLGSLIYTDHYFQCQNKWLIIQINTSYHIFDIENLKIKIKIQNCEKFNQDKGTLIQDYRYKQLDI